MRTPVLPFFVKFCLMLLLATSGPVPVPAQQRRTDSLLQLLAKGRADTNRVRHLWQAARDISVYNPDSAVLMAQQALYLARELNYTEGESRSLGILSNTFLKIGNYSRALELNLEKLQLEERRNNPRNMASVYMNIGVGYILQEEYALALSYIGRADSLVQKYDLGDIRYYTALNTGDAYNRMNRADSAFAYFNSSLEEARRREDIDLVGTSLTGLGHAHRKLGNLENARLHYLDAIRFLTEARDDEMLCEAALGLSGLYQEIGRMDSAVYYARLSRGIAAKDGFLSKEGEAADSLVSLFRRQQRIDSAFFYLQQLRGINDSLNSREKIRQLQVMSSNEQFRQAEMKESRRRAEEERSQQLQLLLIAIFIPGFFLLTMLLSRVNVPVKLIRTLGVLSLLFLFEYLTLLLHPRVAALTHHTPVYEILIFVAVAGLLIPLHHRLEHWLIHHLLHHRHKKGNTPDTK